MERHSNNLTRGAVPFAGSVVLGIAAIFLASIEAKIVIQLAGERADYNEIFDRSHFIFFYLSFGAGISIFIYRWLCLIVRTGCSLCAVLAVAVVVGLAPEILFSWTSYLIRSEVITNLRFLWGLYGFLELLEAPGKFLYWLIFDGSFLRWSEGLTDAPSRMVISQVAIVGSFNALGWVVLAIFGLKLLGTTSVTGSVKAVMGRRRE